MEQEHFEIIIIGAGPIGLACGIEASKKGISYLIIDKGALVNSIYNYPSNMTFFSTSENLEIGEVPFISHNPKPTRAEALEYYRRVSQAWKLKVNLYETVVSAENLSISPNFSNGPKFLIKSHKANYSCNHIIVSTGFFDLPNLLNIPGENLPKVSHYYKEAHPYFGKKLAVIGAANSAVDVALETYRKGAKEVTLIAIEDEIKPSVKYWVRPDIVNRIKEGNIKSYFNSKVLEIKENSLILESSEGIHEIENDFVLAMTGYKPDYQLLEALGVAIEKDEFQSPIHDPDTYESTVESLYLAGVVCGGLKTNKWYIENSRVHAAIILEQIVAKRA